MIFRSVVVLWVIGLLIPDVNTFTLPLMSKSSTYGGCGGSKSCPTPMVQRFNPLGNFHRYRSGLWVSTSSEATTEAASEDEDKQQVAASIPPSIPIDSVSKFRKLKDIMWIREAVEDVTAAEFACSVEGSSEGEKDASLRRKRKRAVDYEKMLANLDRRLNDSWCR